MKTRVGSCPAISRQFGLLLLCEHSNDTGSFCSENQLAFKQSRRDSNAGASDGRDAHVAQKAIADVAAGAPWLLSGGFHADSEVCSIHQAMETARSHVKASWFGWIEFVCAEESGDSTHPLSYKLGSFSEWNHARDFWNFSKTSVVAWLRVRFVWFEPAVEEIVKVQAPVARKNGGFEMVELEILEPISVINYMFGRGGVDIPPAFINEFWDHHRSVGSPWAIHSDATRDHVPLGLFGDAVKYRQKSYGKPEKMLAVFLNAPLWRPKLARASRWLLWAIPEKDLYLHHTVDAVFRRIVWSLNVLHTGVFPTCGPGGETLSGKHAERAGQPISGGLCFATTELRGDWLYHRQVTFHECG